mmetsp:Transcript_11361/g.20635  ORF Transcript_11361/g.20635 Transcript_11361/m.20635 type:complete len:238 (-) Transcript_11361:129-842(-)
MRLFLHNDRSRTVPSSVRASSTEKQQSGNLETAISMDSGDLSTPKQNTRSSFGYGTTPASSFSFPATRDTALTCVKARCTRSTVGPKSHPISKKHSPTHVCTTLARRYSGVSAAIMTNLEQSSNTGIRFERLTLYSLPFGYRTNTRPPSSMFLTTRALMNKSDRPSLLLAPLLLSTHTRVPALSGEEKYMESMSLLRRYAYSFSEGHGCGSTKGDSSRWCSSLGGMTCLRRALVRTK